MVYDSHKSFLELIFVDWCVLFGLCLQQSIHLYIYSDIVLLQRSDECLLKYSLALAVVKNIVSERAYVLCMQANVLILLCRRNGSSCLFHISSGSFVYICMFAVFSMCVQFIHLYQRVKSGNIKMLFEPWIEFQMRKQLDDTLCARRDWAI